MTTGIGTTSFSSPMALQPAQMPTSYDPASTQPTQVSLPKVTLPTLPGIQNPFVDTRLAGTNPPQSVNLNSLTTPKMGVEVPSSHLLNLGKDTGKFSTLDTTGLPPSSNNILSLQGIDSQALPPNQTLQTLQNSPTPQSLSQNLQLTGLPPEEITKINSLEQQIMGQQILNEKIKAVAPKPA